MKKKYKIIVVIILFAGFIYFIFPTNSTKMHNIFQKYFEENIADHEDFEECLFGLYEGPTSGKGYGGFGKYYEINYRHKQHGIYLRLSTDGYEIKDNYDAVKKQIKFIEYAMEIFNERIQDDRIMIHTMSLTENEDYEDTKPTKEYVRSHLEMFAPQIDLLAENMDYEEFKNIDGQISQSFSDIRSYTIIDSKDDIIINSVNLEEFKEFKMNAASKGTNSDNGDDHTRISKSYSTKTGDFADIESIEQYAYTQMVEAGHYGKVYIGFIYNINRNTYDFSFQSFGNYVVQYPRGLDTCLSLISRTCEKLDNHFILKCTFELINLNTHQTDQLKITSTISHQQMKLYNGW